MIKRIIKETISEYDKDGKRVRQTVTETTEDDDIQYNYMPPAWWGYGPTCESTIVNANEGGLNAASR